MLLQKPITKKINVDKRTNQIIRRPKENCKAHTREIQRLVGLGWAAYRKLKNIFASNLPICLKSNCCINAYHQFLHLDQ